MLKNGVDKDHKILNLNGHSFRIPSNAECLLDDWGSYGIHPVVIKPAKKIDGIPAAFALASHSSAPNIPGVAPAIVAEIARRWPDIDPRELARVIVGVARSGDRSYTPDSVLRGIDSILDLDAMGIVNKIVAYPPLPEGQAPEGYPNVLLEDE